VKNGPAFYKAGFFILSFQLREESMRNTSEKRPPCGGPHFNKGHEPNEITKQALKESREGELVAYFSISDFWSAMGIHS
jgi:hypothetical protein